MPPPVGAIVGGVVGGLALIIAAVIGLLLRRRRRRALEANRDSWAASKPGDLGRAQSLGPDALSMRHVAPVEPYVLATGPGAYPTYAPSRQGPGSSIVDYPPHSPPSSSVPPPTPSTSYTGSLSRRPSTTISHFSEGQLFQLAPPVPRLPAQDAGMLAAGPAVLLAKPITLPPDRRPRSQSRPCVPPPPTLDPPPAYQHPA